jgi:hypothetical protein
MLKEISRFNSHDSLLRGNITDRIILSLGISVLWRPPGEQQVVYHLTPLEDP